MKLLLNEKICESVLRCNPKWIAVAYLGLNWRKYVHDPKKIEKIIVSPTLGTNPRAVALMVDEIGWDKLLFLDELHAKVYLGKNEAVVGSANLTDNGLGEYGSEEVCASTTNENQLRKLHSYIDKLARKAVERYPRKSDKQNKLKKLEKQTNAACVAGTIENYPKSVPNFEHFELLSEDHFYVQWYQEAHVKYSNDIESIRSIIDKDLHFHAEDNVETHKWILCWKITNEMRPHKSARLGWMYVHEVFENGVIDEDYEYTKVAIERNDMKVPHPPFELTSEVEDAFKSAVQEEKISPYLVQENQTVFSLVDSFKGVPRLIERMKEKVG